MNSLSPLRYPGGKGKVAKFFEALICLNGLDGGVYVEPFAGGASVALNLVARGVVARALINDADPAIYALWMAIFHDSERLCKRVSETALSVEEWRRQRSVYREPEVDPIDLAFATFYLNRCNRSGVIVNGGLIGGIEQSGPWKMDALFQRADLVRRIERVSALRDHFQVTNLDAGAVLRQCATNDAFRRALTYLDPPYYHRAHTLYRNFYRTHADHQALAEAVLTMPTPWVVSYDNVKEIRDLYSGARRMTYGLQYTARERYEGKEIMLFSPGLRVPSVRSPTEVPARALKARPA